MQGTMPGARRRGRPRTAWMDNNKTWTGLPVEESIRMTEDRDKWRKYVHAWPTLGSRTAEEQNRTEQMCVGIAGIWARSFAGIEKGVPIPATFVLHADPLFR